MSEPYLRRLFETLNGSNVEYCVLRNFEGLPERVEGDVDLLVGLGGMARAERIVRESLAGQVILRRSVRNGHLLLWICGEAELWAAAAGNRPASLVQLDLVTALEWRGVRYLDAAEVLAAREGYRGFYVSSARHHAVHLACHALLDKRAVHPGYARVLARVLSAGGDEAMAPLVHFAGARTVEHLTTALRTGPVPDVARLRRRLIRSLLRRRPSSFLSMLAFSGRKSVRIGRALAAPPGLLIAAIGPDGSGKTTLITRLRTVLAPACDPVREQYMGWKEFVLPTKGLARALRGLRPASSGSVGPGKRGSWAHRLSVLHYLADLWTRYLLRIRPILVRGGLVVCDRYFYDVLAQEGALGESGWARMLLCRTVPRPTLAILFAGDPAMIAARKGELSAADTERQQAALSVVKAFAHVVEVQADDPVEHNVGLVLARLFPR